MRISGNRLLDISDEDIIDGAFVIPDSVEIVSTLAFGDCTSLKSIVIPDSVKHIGFWAFHNCTSLESIVIPDSVTHIAKTAFNNCTSLKNIIARKEIKEEIEYNILISQMRYNSNSKFFDKLATKI